MATKPTITGEAYEGYGATRFTLSDGCYLVVQLCWNGWRVFGTAGEIKFWELAMIPQGQEHRREVAQAAINAM
ncbi:MAG: hypothetical protein E6R03_14130 [Hyphomicrobiaceae bacterium]|nr:MAG: hypothetical protein E6R03_14130 [Hyphomicrobiaceae bacterium]